MDIIKFVDGMLPWLKKEVNSLLSPLENRLSTLENRKPEKGDKGDSVDKSEIAVLVDEAVLARVAEIPPPKDGKDAEIETIKALVAEEAARIPKPENGKDADPELIKSLVAEAVGKIPPPKDGESVEIEQIKALVSAAVAEIPPPTNGKDADIAEIKAIIQQEVAALPKPADGKDADPEQIEKLVNAAFAKIPPPQNGKDADLEIVKGFIQQEVQNIPAPKVESFTLEQVEKMVADAVAAAIANIPPAKDGEDGKDALAIQILPAIDESKSYPRGTFALHKNGTWRAYQKTVGMKGWECTQVGIAEIDIEMLDDRTLSIKTMLSNGETQEKTLKLKNIKYKGVVAEGATYEEGDFVTWGGSIWHCDEPTSERPREGHKSWTLAVKKGRDYREPVKNDFDPNKPVKM
jgi:hypothetical protein